MEKKFYNATESAEYLGVARQRFYVIKDKYQLVATDKGFSARDLSKVRRLLDKWKIAHEKRV